MEFFEKNNVVFNVLEGVVISLLFTIVCLFVFSCLLVYTNLGENLMQPVIIVLTGVSILLGSSIGNRKASKNGILNGLAVGVAYIVCVYIISSIVNGGFVSFGWSSFIMISVGVVAGALGGIIGVNIK